MSTFIKSFTSIGEMPEHVSVNYRTTGQQGGDAGHGGSTELELRVDCGMYTFEIYRGEVCVMGVDSGDSSPLTIKITAQGDWEMEGLDCALVALGESLSTDVTRTRIARLEAQLEREKQKLTRYC